MLAMRLPMQHATWTDGPSFPTESPEAMTRGCTISASGQQDTFCRTYQGYALDEERPESQKSLHDETRDDTLDL